MRFECAKAPKHKHPNTNMRNRFLVLDQFLVPRSHLAQEIKTQLHLQISERGWEMRLRVNQELRLR